MKSYLKDYRIISPSAREIDCSGSWLFWPEKPTELFVQSLGDIGQLEPVLLEESQDGYTLIAGFKRVWACYEIDRNVQGLIISCTELEKGEIYLHSNMHRITDPVSLVPAARFYQMRCRAEEWPGWFNQIAAPFLNLNKRKFLEKWLKLDEYWDYYVTRGHISMDTSPWISEFSEKDLRSIEPFLINLYWSRNNSVSFVKWIYEISKSKDLSVQQVLEQCGILPVLEMDMSPRDRQKKILDILYYHRFPVLHFLHTDFSRLQKEMGIKDAWKLIPEQNFETNRLYLQAKVDNSEELEKAVRELQELKEDGAFEKIWQWQKDNLE